MDQSTRWETEALRGNPGNRSSPPKPSRKRPGSTRTWVTLREAEAETSIPVNTLRKWVRKSALPSYLESDGELAVRMVDLDAVRARATELGRPISPTSDTAPRETAAATSAPEVLPETVDAGVDADDARDAGTMIVPVDAWNKMLMQLGNLHEAGQQLAEARERAAKAETEVTFLRERLAGFRTDVPTPESPPEGDTTQTSPAVGSSDHEVVPDDGGGDTPTTTYWRYLTSGWRNRRRAT